MVNIQERICTCNGWDLKRIPCPHGVCDIYDQDKDPEAFVTYCYHKDVYLQVYQYLLQAIRDEKFWLKT